MANSRCSAIDRRAMLLVESAPGLRGRRIDDREVRAGRLHGFLGEMLRIGLPGQLAQVTSKGHQACPPRQPEN